jgi:ribosomal-protein-alanine acetyltransferase
VLVRRLVPGDLAGVEGLEAQNPSPWSMAALSREVAVPGSRQLVVIAGSRPVAWCACRLIPPEAELLKIAVAGGYRRQGLAGMLLLRLGEILIGEKVGRLFLEVRANNLPARGLYGKYGFVQIGLRRGYYADPPDDALIMVKALAPIVG